MRSRRPCWAPKGWRDWRCGPRPCGPGSVAKISAAIPAQFQPLILDAGARTTPGWKIPPDGLDVAQVRAWIRAGRKIALTYCDEAGRETRRTVWPVIIGYLEGARMLIAWCELRRDFRSFRVDRIKDATFLDERYRERAASLRAKWFASWRREPGTRAEPRSHRAAASSSHRLPPNSRPSPR